MKIEKPARFMERQAERIRVLEAEVARASADRDRACAALEADVARASADRDSARADLARMSLELDRLKDTALICAHCEAQPAVCFGRYEDAGEPEPACGACCGHGNEDGWCIPIGDLPGWAASVDATAREMRADLEIARAELAAESRRAEAAERALSELRAATADLAERERAIDDREKAMDDREKAMAALVAQHEARMRRREREEAAAILNRRAVRGMLPGVR
jgi:hypothetical protein